MITEICHIDDLPTNVMLYSAPSPLSRMPCNMVAYQAKWRSAWPCVLPFGRPDKSYPTWRSPSDLIYGWLLPGLTWSIRTNNRIVLRHVLLAGTGDLPRGQLTLTKVSRDITLSFIHYLFS